MRYFLYIFFCISSSPTFSQYSRVINTTTKVSVQPGKKTTTQSYDILIAQKTDNWLAEVTIPYQLGNTPQIIEAGIYDSQGKLLRKLKKKDIQSRSQYSTTSFYDDHYELYFQLLWNQYPYFLKYTYTHTEKEFMTIVDWYPHISYKIPVKHAELTVTYPNDYLVNIGIRGDYKYISSIDESSTTQKWSTNNLSSVKKETFSKPRLASIPKIAIVPKTFEYDIAGKQDSWSAYGLWQSNINQGLDELTELEKKEIDRITASDTSTIETITKLHNYLKSHTRYLYVGLETGGLKPYPASYVCENKYGDCKALTNYLQSMLKYKGILSYYTKVYAGSNPISIDTQLPSQQFNHVVLCVPVNKDTLWLESTSKYAQYDYIDSFIQGRKGLLVNGSNSKLVEIPALQVDDVLESTTTNILIDDDKDVIINKKINLLGPKYESYYYILHEYSSEEQKEYYEEKNINERIEIASFDLQSSDQKSITIELTGNIDNYIIEVGNKRMLPPGYINLPKLEKPYQRQQPVRINYPINQVDVVNFSLRSPTAKISLPNDIIITSKFGKFEERIVKNDSGMALSRAFILNPGEYTIDEYPDLYAFFENIKEARKNFIILIN